MFCSGHTLLYFLNVLVHVEFRIDLTSIFSLLPTQEASHRSFIVILTTEMCKMQLTLSYNQNMACLALF